MYWFYDYCRGWVRQDFDLDRLIALALRADFSGFVYHGYPPTNLRVCKSAAVLYVF